jgi:hypothetical protein
MPYHDVVGVEVQPSATFTTYYTSPGSTIGPQISTDEGIPYTLLGDLRWGSNAPLGDLVKVYGTAIPQVSYQRRKVGSELAFRWVTRWFKDKKGRSRTRTYRAKYWKPVYVRYLKVVIPKGSKSPPENTMFYLKPNPLTYAKVHNIMVPASLTVKFDIDKSAGHREHGFAKISGCDNFYPQSGSFSVQVPGARYKQPFHPGVMDPDLAEQALNKLYIKAQNELPDYFVSVGESPELLKLIKKISLEGFKLFKEIYHLDVKRLSGRLSSKVTVEDLAGIWLSWIYGIAPTISDITDTIDIVNREARVWRSYSTSAKSIKQLPPDTLQVSPPPKITETEIVRYGMILEGKLSAEKYLLRPSRWQQSAGIIYSLTPGSFILDWFVDIGSYLNSCTVFQNLEYSAWRTHSRKIEYDFKGKFSSYPAGDSSMDSQEFVSKSQSFAMERILLNQLPDMPDIRVNKPTYDNSALQRAINVAAILAANPQFLKPGKKGIR